ncbi:MAG: hypothetical protein H8K07_21505 [Nitrospira sp.]|nr:hypothetical protein [Nitrospira sp.]
MCLQAESGWYHGAREAFVPGSYWDEGFSIFRLVKMTLCFVLAALNGSTYQTHVRLAVSLAAASHNVILTSRNPGQGRITKEVGP